MSQLKMLRETYRGTKASGYEEIRQDEFWDLEQVTMGAILNRLPLGMTLLDCPVGTGRFLAMYDERSYQATGVDLSPDMLREARAKGSTATLAEGSIFDLPYPADSFDVAVCVRLLNWLETYELTAALSSLARVAPLVIAGAGTKNGAVQIPSVQCIHEERDWFRHVEAAGLTVRDSHLVQHNQRGEFRFWELVR